MAKRDIPTSSSLREAYPGNSYKQRDRKADQKEDDSVDESKPQVKQVAKGKVRKQSFAKKIARYIIEDSVETAKEKTLGDIIIPGVKTLIFDTLTDMLDIMLFGGNGAPIGRYSGSNRVKKSSQTSYSKYYDDRKPKNDYRSYRDAPRDPDDIILDTRAQARDALEELDYIIHKYGQASIANFYDIVGVTGEWTDNRYGWTSLRGASIKPVRDGFMIILPPTRILDD